MSSVSSKDQIEFGDASERFTHMLSQNRELKELVIVKESVINTLRDQNIKMEREIQNIMDPLSKNSQLKMVGVIDSLEVQRSPRRKRGEARRSRKRERHAEERVRGDAAES